MMSASQVPTVDRENSAAFLGTHEKHHLLGSQRKLGEHQSRSTPVLKHLGGNAASLQKSQRSFGEISNTLVRGSEGSRHEVHKATPNQSSVVSSASKEPEFIPHIPKRRKDYSDIIPPSLSLSHDQLTSFSHFWKSCQKPDLHSCEYSQISASPPRGLTYLPIVKNDEKVVLEPVPEDLFDLPPSWE